MNINKDDILGRAGKFIADRRKLDPGLDPEYIKYDTETDISSFNSNVKEGVREMKLKRPQEYACFFPRVYRNVEEYDWRWANYAAAMHVALAREYPEYIEHYDSQRNAVHFSAMWLATGVNQFFVSPKLMEAVRQTDPPAGIDFGDFKMPYEAIVFQLPKGGIQFRGEDCSYIGIARIPAGKGTLLTPLTKMNLDMERPRFIFTATFRGLQCHFGVGGDPGAIKKIVDGGIDILAYTNEVSGCNVKPNGRITDDVVLVNDIIRTSLNLILAMEVQPALVERGRRVTQHRKERSREIWEPNFVGRKYRTILKAGAEAGTHASPRMHWRRGHFRRQGLGRRKSPFVCRCSHGLQMHYEGEFCMEATCGCLGYVASNADGPGYEAYKTIWIEPVLVNAAA